MLLLKQKILLSLCLLLLVFGCASIPHLAEARGLVPCGGYADDQGTREQPCQVKDVFVMIAVVTNWLIGASALYAVYQIINHGFYLIVSMGNEEKITQHKEGISNSVIGFVVVLLAFMFINTVVNVLLTRSIVTTPGSPQYDESCKLDLRNPLTYLTITDPSKCTNIPDPKLGH